MMPACLPLGLAGATDPPITGTPLGGGLSTDEPFATGNDEDNRAAVRAVEAEKLKLAGLGLFGPRNAVDKVTKGLPLHG
jgi:hypothetical protein